MATRCLALCQDSHLYEGLFEVGRHCISLKDDLSDFDKKLDFCLNENDAIKDLIESAFQHVMARHTWEKRVEQFTDSVISQT